MSVPEKLRYISKNYIQQWLPDNPIIIEAGSHCGRDTLLMKKTWPRATIHAFEPISYLFERLVIATKQINGIHCHPYALADKTGWALFYESNEHLGAVSSLLKPKEFLHRNPPVTFKQYQIATMTLDDWAVAHNIHAIDFLWLDMQGFELLMLQASPTILKTVKAIHMEVSLTYRYEQNPLYPEIKQWIESQGFTIVAEALYQGTWGNILCIRTTP